MQARPHRVGKATVSNDRDEQTLDLHHQAILIDSTCPIIAFPHIAHHLKEWITGGATCIGAEVAGSHSTREAIGSLSAWHRELHQRGDLLLLASKARDIKQAKRQGKLAVVFHFQNTQPIEYDLGLLAIYQQLGVRIIQLAYNRRNPVGDGCEEQSDAGLSEFGRAVVLEMNRLGILIDLSHTGRQTTLEAIDRSTQPCVFTHSNAEAICPHPRNVTDEQIRAVADKGGVIGLAGFPSFVAKSPRPTLDDFIDHIDYIVGLVGPDHVGLGLDYARDPSDAEYEEAIRIGKWRRENYPPAPWHYPAGLENASRFPNLTRRLLERGYSRNVVLKVLGENFLRVFGQVWGA